MSYAALVRRSAAGDARINHPFRGDYDRVRDLGAGVWIDRFAWFSIAEGARFGVGVDTYVGRHAIFSVQADVRIGARNVLAERVFVTDANRDYTDPAPILHRPRPTLGPVVTGPDCWIGVGACLLAGARLGRGCVVAANAVVVDAVDDFTVVAGVPARPIRRRDPESGEWVRVGGFSGGGP